MSKRTQEDAGEEMSHSKIEADDEFGLAMQRKGIRKPGENRIYESQILLSSWNEQQPRTVRPVMGASS